MPVYTYICDLCDTHHEQTLSVANRHAKAICPVCESNGLHQKIQLQTFHGKAGHQNKLISDAECEGKYGKDWRETPESIRIKEGKAKRLYSDGGKK